MSAIKWSAINCLRTQFCCYFLIPSMSCPCFRYLLLYLVRLSIYLVYMIISFVLYIPRMFLQSTHFSSESLLNYIVFTTPTYRAWNAHKAKWIFIVADEFGRWVEGCIEPRAPIKKFRDERLDSQGLSPWWALSSFNRRIEENMI